MAFISRAAPICACDSTVRGQAFVDRRDVHKLCVITNGDDPARQTLTEELTAWLLGPGKDFNAVVHWLDAQDESIEWRDYGIPSAPPMLPVVVLIGYDRAGRRSFVIDHWEPSPAPADLEALKTSPLREAIKREIGARWAVLLHSPGASSDGRTSAVLDAVVKEWAEKHDPGVSVVRFDRHDPRERLLVSFAGIDPDGPDWVGIAFGRGKLLAPPLQGAEITEEAVDALLSQLVEICSCLRPPAMMGVDIPMTWEEELDEKVVSLVPPAADRPTSAPTRTNSVSLPSTDRRFIATAAGALAATALLIAGVTWSAASRHRTRANR